MIWVNSLFSGSLKTCYETPKICYETTPILLQNPIFVLRNLPEFVTKHPNFFVTKSQKALPYQDFCYETPFLAGFRNTPKAGQGRSKKMTPEIISTETFAVFFVIGLFIIISLMILLANAVSKREWAEMKAADRDILRDQLNLETRRRERAQEYLLDKLHTHDREFIDYQFEKKTGMLDFLRRKPQELPQPNPRSRLRVQQYNAPPPPPRQQEHHYEPPPRPQPNFRQPETPREPPPRVIVITEPPRESRLRRLNFLRDDVIDVEPNEPEPHNPHKPMLQLPFFGKVKKKPGRKAKYKNSNERQSAYYRRKKEKKS